MKTIREIQAALGVTIDGKPGPETTAAIVTFQTANNLPADGIAGPLTQAVMFPPKPGVAPKTQFDAQSLVSVVNAHPKLQLVLYAARQEIEFRVLDSRRGKAAQEKAFKEGKSKAHFGQSAHNYAPSIAVDLFPAPYKWDNTASFDRLAKVVMRIAKEKNIPLRWGGDWNMDGDKTKSDAWDRPHFELHPWREFAKESELYKG